MDRPSARTGRWGSPLPARPPRGVAMGGVAWARWCGDGAASGSSTSMGGCEEAAAAAAPLCC
eukprot:3452358-Prymnesium_polylepis.1